MKFISQDCIISVANSAGFIRSVQINRYGCNTYWFDEVFLIYKCKEAIFSHKIKEFKSQGQGLRLRTALYITEPFHDDVVELMSLKFWKKSNLIMNWKIGIKRNAAIISPYNNLMFHVCPG